MIQVILVSVSSLTFLPDSKKSANFSGYWMLGSGFRIFLSHSPLGLLRFYFITIKFKITYFMPFRVT